MTISPRYGHVRSPHPGLLFTRQRHGNSTGGRTNGRRSRTSTEGAGTVAAEGYRAPRAAGAVWILLMGLLLAGVVALNVAVLRLNLRYDELTQERRSCAENAELASNLAARSSSPRTSSLAKRRLGLQPADPRPEPISTSAKMTPQRHLNRRVRLLLIFFVLAFLGTFGRAVWLQAVQAQPLDRLARGQHTSRSKSRRHVGRSSTATASSLRSGSRRSPSTRTRGMSPIHGPRRSQRGGCSESTPTAST